jgi:hypothetical protein
MAEPRRLHGSFSGAVSLSAAMAELCDNQNNLRIINVGKGSLL